MSLSAAVLRALIETGATPEMLIKAAEAEERRQEDKADHVRELARLRKAAQRHREKVTNVTRDIGDKRDQRDEHPPSPALSPQTPQTHPHPPEGNTPAREEPVAQPKIGTRIGDYEPSIEVAVSMGLTADRARFEADSFKDFWIGKPGKDGRKLDWPATWRNWVRGKVSKGQTGLRVVNGQGPPRERDGDRARSTLDRMIAEAEGAERPANDRNQQHERTIDGYAQRSR